MSPRPFKGVRLARIVRVGHAHPAQWHLWTEDGRFVFAHFRRGCFCLSVDDPSLQKEGWDFSWAHGHLFAGHMSDAEMLELTGFLVTEKTEFPRGD